MAVVVHQEQFFDAVLVQHLFGLLKGCAHGCRHEPLFGSHKLHHGLRAGGHKANVAIGQQADQFARFGGDGHARDAVTRHERFRIGQSGRGGQGNRVYNHARLGAFDLVHFFGLLFDGHVAMQHAHAAQPGQPNGHAPLGHGIHRGRNQRYIQPHTLGQLGADIHVGR